MIPSLSVPPRLVAALASALAALLFATFSLWRALTLEPAVQPGSRKSPVLESLPPGATVRVRVDSLVGVTVLRDPFRPDRRPPPSRFRMPGEPVGHAEPGRPGVGNAPLRLVGTAVSRGGSDFAVCQAGSEPPKLVRVGQVLNGFTLLEVEKERAVFRDSLGMTIELVVPGTGI